MAGRRVDPAGPAVDTAGPARSPRHGREDRPYYVAREWVRKGHVVRMVAAS